MRSLPPLLLRLLASAFVLLTSVSSVSGTASVQFFDDLSCQVPSIVSAQGGFVSGVCTHLFNQYLRLSQRVTCTGGVPLYEQFYSSDCSGTASGSWQDNTTTGTQCLTSSSSAQRITIQCNEATFNDRIASYFYSDSKCNATASAYSYGPFYGLPIGQCHPSGVAVGSSSHYCTTGRESALSYSYYDRKCTTWRQIDVASTGCTTDSSYNSMNRVMICPTNSVLPPTPTYPPTGNDVAISRNCFKPSGGTSCQINPCTIDHIYRLGQCQDQSQLANQGPVESQKLVCTQNGANFATLTYDDYTCRGNITKAVVELAGAADCKNQAYIQCPDTVAPTAQMSPPPAIASLGYFTNDCKKGTNGGAYISLLYVQNDVCIMSAKSVANTTHVTEYQFNQPPSAPYTSCAGTVKSAATYPQDACVSNPYGGSGSSMRTSTLSPNSSFVLDIGSATAANTAVQLIGSPASITFESTNSVSNLETQQQQIDFMVCISGPAQVLVSRMVFVSATSTPPSNNYPLPGSSVTIQIRPTSFVADVTPDQAVSTLQSQIANGGLKDPTTGVRVCTNIQGTGSTTGTSGGTGSSGTAGGSSSSGGNGPSAGSSISPSRIHLLVLFLGVSFVTILLASLV